MRSYKNMHFLSHINFTSKNLTQIMNWASIYAKVCIKGSLTQHSFLKDFIYLFLERGEGRERGREISRCGCL